MRTLMTSTMLLALTLGAALPAPAQIGDILRKAQGKVDEVQARLKPYTDKAKQLSDINKPWSAEDEEQIGEASSARIIHIFGGLYENPAMQKYVNLVGNTVARQGTRSGVSYRFAILDTDIMNALAVPGGFCFITRGALMNMKNEAELAGVLAHEAAHVDSRHLENEIKKKGNTVFALQEGQQRGQTLSKDEYVQMAIRKFGDAVVNQALTASFSKGDESDADRKGLDFAAKAGYDPAGLRDFLRVLAGASADPDYDKATAAWSQTHPPITDRVDTLTRLMASYGAGGQTLEARFRQNVNDKAFTGQ